MNQVNISRRTVLKLGGGLLAAAPFLQFGRVARANATEPVLVPTRRPFGRAIQYGLAVREAPGLSAKLVRWLAWNEIITLKGQTTSDDSPTSYNHIWYQTTDGYIYSAFVQPVDNVTNKPVETVDEKGFWGEITVPFTQARGGPGEGYYVAYLFNYGCVFHVMTSRADKNGVIWYQCDYATGSGLWIRADSMRVIPAEEFLPLSPDVPAELKRIEVDVTNQLTTAFEGDKAVFSARVATGANFTLSDGTVKYFRTIPGDHRVFLKSASQHMKGGTAGDTDYYDLPGIGWCSYFTTSGIAFHGTYWHNDYGKPRSHGCVNMLPEDAKFIFRWTMPPVPYDQLDVRTLKPDEGTLVKVF
ncbi:MAG TPA: L,D-transpeptidase family protein [Anaerolineae bacterium]